MFHALCILAPPYSGLYDPQLCLSPFRVSPVAPGGDGNGYDRCWPPRFREGPYAIGFRQEVGFPELQHQGRGEPPPVDFSVDYLSITVSAPDFETITRDIPLDTGQLTLEVPAGTTERSRSSRSTIMETDISPAITAESLHESAGGRHDYATDHHGKPAAAGHLAGNAHAGTFGVSVDWNESAGAEGITYPPEMVDGPYVLIVLSPDFPTPIT